MEIMICIGQRLREVREAMALSQSDFAAIAEKAGVPGATRQSQAKYEKGLQAPGATYLAAIAAHGADVLFILTGQRSSAPPAPTAQPDEQALLENYRHAPQAQKDILQATGAAFAKGSTAARKRAA